MKNRLGFTLKTVLTVLLCVAFAVAIWIFAKM